jgi:hypothetical protein
LEYDCTTRVRTTYDVATRVGTIHVSTTRVGILLTSDLRLIETACIHCLCKPVFGTELGKSSSVAFNSQTTLPKLVFTDCWDLANPNNLKQHNVQRGHPGDILIQVLHGNAEPTAEEANAISRRIGELRSFLESLHPPQILPPIAQGQQLGVEIQAQGNSDMNHQVLQPAVDTVDMQDTLILPGESMVAGVFDNHFRPTNRYSAA